MASILKHLRSSTADKRPTASGLADGQIALNTASGTPAMFFKDSAGNIVKVGPAHIGTTAPNVSPAGSAGNSDGELWIDESLTTRGLKYYDGTAFINLTPSGTTSTVGLVELATDAETQAGTDNARVVTPSGLQSKISDSTSTTSSTTIASSTAVKSAFDLANAALPKTGGTLTGELLISPSGSLVFEGSSDDSFETTIAVTNPTADRTITFPNVTGNVVTTGDSGTVTSTMILDDTIVNADINSAAAIAHSKLANITAGSVLLGNASNVPTATALSGDVTINSSGVTAISAGVIVNADINASAAIVDTKLDTIATADKVSLSALNIDGATDIGGALENGDLFIVDDGAGGTNRKAQAFRMAQLTYSGVTGDITVASGGTAAISAGVIVNADVNASAAIAGTKISPDFGSQTITTTGVVSAALGAAATPSLTFTGDLNTGIYSPGADQVAISTNGAGRAVIGSTGRLGLGTLTPGTKIDIVAEDNTSLNPVLRVNSNNVAVNTALAYDGLIGNSQLTIGNTSANPIVFNTNSSEKVRITSAGLVGIGTSSPGGRLETNELSNGAETFPLYVANTGSGVNTRASIRFNIANSYYGSIGGGAEADGSSSVVVDASSSTGIIRFTRNNKATETARFDGSGRLGIGTTPDKALTVSQVGGDGDGIKLIHPSRTGTWLVSHSGVSSENLSFFQNNGTSQALSYLMGRDLHYWQTGGTERARIDSSGYFYIGTTNNPAAAQLIVTKPGGAQGFEFLPGSATTTNTVLHFNRAGNAYLTSTVNALDHTWQTSGTERARIDSSGRLLVGTSSTSSNTTLLLQGYNGTQTNAGGHLRLAIPTATPANGANLGLVLFSDSEHTNCAYISGDRDGGTWSSSSKPTRLVFSTTADGASSPTERMRIGNNGNVFLSCTSEPSASVFGVAIIDNSSSGRQYRSSVNSTSAYNHFAFLNTNGVVGTISTSGSATAYNTSSDYRLKENVTAVTDGITRLQQLKPSRFNFIADPDKTVDGFIAHEVQAVVPEAITGEKDAVDEEGNPKYQGIDQSKLVPLLTAALQEAVAKIESLEARLTAAGI